MLLRHSANLEAEALAIEGSVRQVLEKGYRTRDLLRSGAGEPLSTQEMGSRINDALIAGLRENAQARQFSAAR